MFCVSFCISKSHPEVPANNSLTFGYTWNYPIPDVKITESANGYTSYEWGHYYQPGAPCSTSVQTNQPGIDVDNRSGSLVLALDDKLNMTDTEVGSYSTGDEGDTVVFSDF